MNWIFFYFHNFPWSWNDEHHIETMFRRSEQYIELLTKKAKNSKPDSIPSFENLLRIVKWSHYLLPSYWNLFFEYSETRWSYENEVSKYYYRRFSWSDIYRNLSSRSKLCRFRSIKINNQIFCAFANLQLEYDISDNWIFVLCLFFIFLLIVAVQGQNDHILIGKLNVLVALQSFRPISPSIK